MVTDKDIKKEFKAKASKDPDKYYKQPADNAKKKSVLAHEERHLPDQ